MGVLGRLSDLLAANIHDLIDTAEDPVKQARQLIREMDDQIIALRGKQRVQRTRVESAKRQLDRKQQEVGEWQARAERAVDEEKDDLARSALQRKHRLEAEATTFESTWWEATQEAEALEAQLHQLEDQAQRARRHKESLIAHQRQGRSSSDFIAISPDTSAPTETRAFDEMRVDEELQRLKEKRQQ